MVKRYVKKPIPVEAIQYDGRNFDELHGFAGDDVYMQDGWVCIHTLEGDMKMKNKTGDYFIKGTQGEFYPCEKSIFESTYEELDDRSYVCASSLY